MSMCISPFLLLCSSFLAPPQTPLNDLGTATYQGFEGGLYSGGSNTPPANHFANAISAATSIVPRDSLGTPSNQGLIGFISLTMSNVNQEWAAFKLLMDQDDHRNSRVVLISGAQQAQALNDIANPAALYWNDLAARVSAAGLTPQQVQVVWLKMADSVHPTNAFPAHAQTTQQNAKLVLQNLKTFYPNLKIAYFASRIYGGYAQASSTQEPIPYETGFAVKWLIEAQIAGAPGLSFDTSGASGEVPLILWGPYLWANGTTPRSDGLVWLRTDLEPNGVHPTLAGEQKVAAMLQDFFQADASATPWFLRPMQERLTVLHPSADAWVDDSSPTTNHGSDPTLRAQSDFATNISYLKFDLPSLNGVVARAELCIGSHPLVTSSFGTEVYGLSDITWDEMQITFNNRPAIDGLLHGSLPIVSRSTMNSIDVTIDIQSAVSNSQPAVSFAISSAVGSGVAGVPKLFASREAMPAPDGTAPYLLLTILPDCNTPGVPYCRSSVNSTGQQALLHLSGSASYSQNDLVIHASGMPPGVEAFILLGFDSWISPISNGILGIPTPLAGMSPAMVVNAQGSIALPVDWSRTPINPGDVIYVQCGYREIAGTGGLNFSDAMLISVCP